MPDRIILEVGNRNYWGWNRMSIVRSMESLSAEFSIDLVTGKDFKLNTIRPGDECRVYLEDSRGHLVQMMVGWVEDRNRSKAGKSSSLGITGRDVTADLVDCAAIVKSNAWTDTTLIDLAKDLCKPFGINVLDATDETTKYKEIAVQSGETCFSIIERVCRQAGVLPLTTEDGDLIFAYSANENQKPGASLVLGNNILKLDEKVSYRQRFSQYTIKGQGKAGGKPWQSNKVVDLEATAQDRGIERYRPTVVMSEGKTDGGKIQKRANWEAQIRSGRSTVYTVTLRGWFQSPGTEEEEPTPWRVNTLVYLIADSYDLNLLQLITTVEFTLDSTGGRKTVLTLKDPNTYSKNPEASING